jgi:2,5-diamino-6-(ribosylamino)-4(3H)-pyrimidinone 5'-phosphate reductase
MKKPEVIMHNSISLDGCIRGFEANQGLHYRIVGNYQADIYLAGSNTAKTGIEMFGGIPAETEADFIKPAKGAGLSYWVIPDTRGVLKGMLHTLRRFEFCRDAVILLSSKTDRSYIEYLEARHYDYLVCADDFVDYKQAFEGLGSSYNAKRILVDTGPTLSGILLKQGLVDKISLLIHPFLVGNKNPTVFGQLDIASPGIELKLEKSETLEQNYLWIIWKVLKRETACQSENGGR